MLKTPLIDLPSDSPHPGVHKLLSRAVADWLAQRIVSGEEAPGSRLTETKLAALAGVSRSPVREALRILCQEGLVEIAPRHGAQVVQVGPADVRELYACRMLIEPRCTSLAVAALTEDGLAQLDGLRAAMEQAVAEGDPRRFLAENIAYFGALLGSCPNATIRDLVELTWNKSRRYWSIFARLPHYAEGSLAQHLPLHEAVRAGDSAAAAVADLAILERAQREILATLEDAVA